MEGCQNDRATGVDGHVYFVADLDAGEVHQRSIEDDALGISELRNRLGHDVILCFTNLARQPENYDIRNPLAARGFRKVRSKKEELRSGNIAK